MKLRTTFFLILTLTGVAPLNSQAEDLFQLFWRGTSYTTNEDGRIIATPVHERQFVNKVAQNNGLNPNDLIFVYRPNLRDTAVVFKTNGVFVADVIQMEINFTDVVNPSGGVIVKHALLFDENHSVPLGSFLGVETRQPRFSGGGVSAASLTGTAFYSFPEENKVCQARITTGRRVRDTSTQ